MKKNTSLTKKDSKYWDALSQMITECERLRLQKELSQKDLAERMGTTQSVISRFENMGRTPNYDFIVRLADALDCSVNIVFNKNNTEMLETEVSLVFSSVDECLPADYERKYSPDNNVEDSKDVIDNLAA